MNWKSLLFYLIFFHLSIKYGYNSCSSHAKVNNVENEFVDDGDSIENNDDEDEDVAIEATESLKALISKRQQALQEVPLAVKKYEEGVEILLKSTDLSTFLKVYDDVVKLEVVASDALDNATTAVFQNPVGVPQEGQTKSLPIITAGLALLSKCRKNVAAAASKITEVLKITEKSNAEAKNTSNELKRTENTEKEVLIVSEATPSGENNPKSVLAKRKNVSLDPLTVPSSDIRSRLRKLPSRVNKE